jgi:hypothetical protein
MPKLMKFAVLMPIRVSKTGRFSVLLIRKIEHCNNQRITGTILYAFSHAMHYESTDNSVNDQKDYVFALYFNYL